MRLRKPPIESIHNIDSVFENPMLFKAIDDNPFVHDIPPLIHKKPKKRTKDCEFMQIWHVFLVLVSL